MVLSNGFWPFPLHSAHSLPLLIPLFPSTPTLSVVKHVVKGPFLTRRGITAVACSEGPFFMFRFGVLYLCRGREARGFFEPGVSIFNTPIQRKTHEPVTLLLQNLFFIKRIEFDKNDKNDYNDN